MSSRHLPDWFQETADTCAQPSFLIELQDLDQEPATRAKGSSSGSSLTESGETPQIVEPCRVTSAVPSSAKLSLVLSSVKRPTNCAPQLKLGPLAAVL